eukprot:31550_1
MTDAETIALTTQQQQQPQVVIVPQNQNQQYYVPQNQNVQYVYAQPSQAGTNATGHQQNVQYVYATPQQQTTGGTTTYGYHQPRHQAPPEPNYDADDHDTSKDSDAADVNVVEWSNFKLPIPVNHATFMRKVWCTLVLQLIFTAGIIAMCMYVDEIREWVVANNWMWIVGLFGSICVLCALFPARTNYPLNLCLLFLWTSLMAYTVATVCAAYAEIGMADIVMQAFGITILVFLGLSLFSCQTKCNLMPLGMIAFCMLSVMFWWGMWAIIFGWYNSSGWALMFIIIFCLLIMFDVWRMCNMPAFEGDWILGAINLYLDVINLFLWILRFMALTQR